MDYISFFISMDQLHYNFRDSILGCSDSQSETQTTPFLGENSVNSHYFHGSILYSKVFL